MQISITVLFPSGALELSALVNGHLVSRRYMGFTRKEAREMFKASIS